MATLMFQGVSTNSQWHINFADGAASRLNFYSYQDWQNNVLSLMGNGNVGIGLDCLQTPSARLHVSNGGIKLEGINEFEFGSGMPNKEWSAGKIAYQKWSPGLDIVGAGTLGGTRRITFHSEGGAYFNGLVYSNGTPLISDRRVKKNIVNTTDALTKLLQLRSVDYLFVDSLEVEETVIIETNSKDTSSTSLQKTTNSSQTDKSAIKWKESKKSRTLRFDSEKGIMQHGFVAQEVEKIMPELVKTQPNGIKAVNYIAVIPILVEAMKEQNQKIEVLEAEIKKLKKGKAAAKTDDTKATEKATDAILYQNSPNPFSGETQIKYYLPETVQNSFITITDLSGKQVKLVSLSTKGESSVVLKVNELQAGMYLYTLVADGTIVDSKRMVIVE